jgi:hypothetical protein
MVELGFCSPKGCSHAGLCGLSSAGPGCSTDVQRNGQVPCRSGGLWMLLCCWCYQTAQAILGLMRRDYEKYWGKAVSSTFHLRIIKKCRGRCGTHDFCGPKQTQLQWLFEWLPIKKISSCILVVVAHLQFSTARCAFASFAPTGHAQQRFGAPPAGEILYTALEWQKKATP